MDVNQIEAKITSKTKAIMPVHLYGQCVNNDVIQQLAEKYNLFVIEDAAQAIGSAHKGKRSGALGTMACFSFFPTKNLGAYGDGGMIVTDNDELADKLRMLRAHGSKPKYYHHVLGYNSRLDELQAAILNVKFPHIDTWISQRQSIAKNMMPFFGKVARKLFLLPWTKRSVMSSTNIRLEANRETDSRFT